MADTALTTETTPDPHAVQECADAMILVFHLMLDADIELLRSVQYDQQKKVERIETVGMLFFPPFQLHTEMAGERARLDRINAVVNLANTLHNTAEAINKQRNLDTSQPNA